MKVIYSLKEFRQRVVQISGKEPNLVHVRVEIELFGRTGFSCYVDGLGSYFTGITMEESLEKLQKAVTPPKPADIDVEIELELPSDEPIEEQLAEEKSIPEPDDLPF